VLISKTVLLGLTVFLIGAVIYMLVAPRLIRARGIYRGRAFEKDGRVGAML
jgi:hypothetical protein